MVRRVYWSRFYASHPFLLPDDQEPVLGHGWCVEFELDLTDSTVDVRSVLNEVLESLEDTV